MKLHWNLNPFEKVVVTIFLTAVVLGAGVFASEQYINLNDPSNNPSTAAPTPTKSTAAATNLTTTPQKTTPKTSSSTSKTKPKTTSPASLANITFTATSLAAGIPNFSSYADVIAKKINNSNTVIIDAKIDEFNHTGFVWTSAAGIKQLCSYCEVSDINDSGTISGKTYDQMTGESRGATWNSAGTKTDISQVVGKTVYDCPDINNQGVVICRTTIDNAAIQSLVWDPSSGVHYVTPDNAAYSLQNGNFASGLKILAGITSTPTYSYGIWNSKTGTSTALGLFNSAGTRPGAINDSSQVTGVYQPVVNGTPTDRGFFRDTSGGFHEISIYPGDLRSYAGHINSLGQVDCTSMSDTQSGPNGDVHSYIWELSSGYKILPPLPGGSRSYAADVNNSTYAVGYAYNSASKITPVLWTPVR